MLPKILLASPTARVKDYAFSRWSEQSFNLSYAHYSTYMVNNSDLSYSDKIREVGIECDTVEGGNGFLVRSQNLIRDKVLKGNYDYLLMLESDVFVRKDIIEYMLSFGKQVMNITYFIDLERHNDSTLCLQYTHKGKGWAKSYPIYHDVKDGDLANEGLSHAGLGCTLIHRSVLERVEFRAKRGIFADSFFHLDVNKLGIPNHVTLDYIAEHWNN